VPILIVKNQGQVIQKASLEKGKEYIIGRAENCDIRLPDEPGISRQHLKVISLPQKWIVEMLSKYGALYQDDEKLGSLELSNGSRFQVPPFDFEFLEAAEDDLRSDTDEKTQVASIHVTANLKVYDANNVLVQRFNLIGENWVLGRDLSCTLVIDNPRFSRRHFEICREGGIFLIKDLESANGTILNNEKVSYEKWQQLNSGDAIKVADYSLVFELRDAQYEKKMMEAGVAISPTVTPTTTIQSFENKVSDNPKFVLNKKLIIRYGAIFALILIVCLNFLMEEKSTETKVESAKVSSSSQQFDQLKPEHQAFVKRTYVLAKELFMQGKYEMSRQEILKIQQFVPFYEDSREIEASAIQAIQLKQEQERLENEEKQKIAIEEKIQKQIKICRSKLGPKVEEVEIDDCLSAVIHFNPEHPAIIALKQETNRIIEDRNVQMALKADYQERVQKLRAIFQEAERFFNSGQQVDALKKYKDVLRSSHPDPNKLKSIAKTKASELEKSLQGQQQDLLLKSADHEKNGNLKLAIDSLQTALSLIPNNKDIEIKLKSLRADHRKQMQTLYQEGILEESVGEVESAKTKWKKIIDQSFPDEEYFKKSQIKLRKYGAI
jgi:pSer/pThr/pTyr-binding forkhead associated (FHA) protein